MSSLQLGASESGEEDVTVENLVGQVRRGEICALSEVFSKRETQVKVRVTEQGADCC